MALSFNKRKPVKQENTDSGWLGGGTATSRFTLNEQVNAFISTSLVSDIQTNISNTNFTYTYVLITLPPVPGTTTHIPPILTTGAKSFVQYFIRRGILNQPHIGSRYIASP